MKLHQLNPFLSGIRITLTIFRLVADWKTLHLGFKNPIYKSFAMGTERGVFREYRVNITSR